MVIEEELDKEDFKKWERLEENKECFMSFFCPSHQMP
jgi:hypothetical protein